MTTDLFAATKRGLGLIVARSTEYSSDRHMVEEARAEIADAEEREAKWRGLLEAIYPADPTNLRRLIIDMVEHLDWLMPFIPPDRQCSPNRYFAEGMRNRLKAAITEGKS